MSTTTIQDLITKAMQKLGLVAAGETPTTDELNDGMDALNMMLESWSGRNLVTVATIQENYPLTANQANYAIGTGQGFNSTKPFSIEGGFVRDGNNDDTILKIIDRDTYNRIQFKDFTGRPDSVFYDAGATQQANQAGTLYFYPVPDASTTYTVYLDMEKPFTEAANLSDAVTFPPGYKRAIVHNLAIEIATDFGVDVPAAVAKIADDSMRIIENINASNKQAVSATDFPAGRSSFNIQSGD